MELLGKRAMVCGASRGIGKAIAISLADQGASVVLLARNAEKLSVVQGELDTSHDQEHIAFAVDFLRPDKVIEALKNVIAEPASIDILVNNTGGPSLGQLYEAELQSLADAFTMHVLTSQALVRALIPNMKQAGFGRIVNIISTSVKEPIDGLGVSNTIRGAMASWSKTLSRELAEFKITVNNVLPGYTDTDRLQELIDVKAVTAGIEFEVMANRMKRDVPSRRFAEPEEIASVVKFLCSSEASYINGVNIPVDGGRTKCL